MYQVVDGLVLMNRDGEVNAINVHDCSVKWTWKGNHPADVQFTSSDDSFYVAEQPQKGDEVSGLVAIDARSGIEKWRTRVDSRIAITVHAGVLVVQGKFEVAAINPGSGKTVWQAPILPNESSTTLPAPFPVQSGRLLVAEIEPSPTRIGTATFYALDLYTGEASWSFQLPNVVMASFAAGPERLAILRVVSAEGGKITHAQIGIDVSTGDEIWAQRFDFLEDINLLVDDIRILGPRAYGIGFPSDSWSSLVALDVATGSAAWTANIPGLTKVLAQHDEILLVGVLDLSDDSGPAPPWRLIAYDIGSGSIVWTRLLQHNFTNDLEWGIVNGSVVFAEGNTLNAVDIETGDLIWSYSDPMVTPIASITVGENILVVADLFEGRALFLEPPKVDR